MYPHENRFFASLNGVDAERALRREFKALLHTAIDGLIEVARDERRLGPVGPELEGARVGLEHFSDAPRTRDVSALLHKLSGLALVTELPSTRRAALVVLCRGSAGALHRLPLIPHPEYRGWWRLTQAHHELHVLEAHRLARDGTWGLVRFACNPVARGAQNLVAELLGDPLLPTVSKSNLMVAIMNNEIENLSHTEVETAAQRVMRVARAEGVAKGLAKGRAERRESLLRVARSVCPDEATAELAKIGDIEWLEAEVLRWIAKG